MRVLVTGATGFVGTNLVKRLQEIGWQANLLARSDSDTSKVLGKSTNIYIDDLINPKSLESALKGVEIVFHLAAGLPNHQLTYNEYKKVNAEGTRSLLKACLGKNIKRFVHISTVGIYGPPTPYSKTKKLAEEYVFYYWKKHKLPVTIIRPTIAYGPFDKRPGFLNLFRLIRKGIFIPIGKGENFFHTIYIDNLVDAMIEASKNPMAIGQAFNVGDSPCPTMKDILKNIYKVSGKPFPSFYIPTDLAQIVGVIFDQLKRLGLPALLSSQRVRFITEDKKYDIGNALSILKWKPKVSLESGLKKTYDWYERNNWL